MVGTARFELATLMTEDWHILFDSPAKRPGGLKVAGKLRTRKLGPPGENAFTSTCGFWIIYAASAYFGFSEGAI